VEQLLRIVRKLQQENQQLSEEIDPFNGRPVCPRRPMKASTLNDGNGKSSEIATRRNDRLGNSQTVRVSLRTTDIFQTR
jgi:hypothetical protein